MENKIRLLLKQEEELRKQISQEAFTASWERLDLLVKELRGLQEEIYRKISELEQED